MIVVSFLLLLPSNETIYHIIFHWGLYWLMELVWRRHRTVRFRKRWRIVWLDYYLHLQVWRTNQAREQQEVGTKQRLFG
jgi:hypothetical protein